MKYKRLKSIILLIGLTLTGLQAQESINAAGGNGKGIGGSMSYSVGQMVYQTYSGTNGSVSQGVQQPYEISITTGIKDFKGINLLVSAYPNPTTDRLTVQIENYKITNLSYQLFNIKGKILKSEKITDRQTSIIMSNLIPSAYFVRILEGDKEIKTFKIIKN